MQAPSLGASPPAPNPRLLNLLMVIYLAATLAAAGLIAYAAWDRPADPQVTIPEARTPAIARQFAEQRNQRRLILQLGGFLAFAWLGGVLLLRTRASYLKVLADTGALKEEIVELNRKDPLTGLANRRSMPDALARMTAQADRERKHLAIAVLDVDQFKPLNDIQGYKAGDACLMAVAGVIQKHSRRPLDLAVRMDGEEFLIGWYDTGPEHAQRMARDIQAQVRALPLRRPEGNPVTVSIGLMLRPPGHDQGWETLVRRAEDAMYQARALGREQLKTA